jgi:hypothetical protein
MVEGRHKEVVLSKGDDAAAACISLSKKLNKKCESKSVQQGGVQISKLGWKYQHVWINAKYWLSPVYKHWKAHVA